MKKTYVWLAIGAAVLAVLFWPRKNTISQTTPTASGSGPAGASSASGYLGSAVPGGSSVEQVVVDSATPTASSQFHSGDTLPVGAVVPGGGTMPGGGIFGGGSLPGGGLLPGGY